MNFYSFHMGDYHSATAHLSWEEDLAYRRLIDLYYIRGAALPPDRKDIYRLIRAVTPKQRQSVDAVLAEFFTVTEEGFFNGRCASELEVMAEKSRKAKASAENRWRNANASAFAMRTHSEGNATNTNTNTNSSTRRLDNPTTGPRARDDLEAKLRTAAGWQNEPAPMLAVTGPIQALIDNGADLERDVLPVVARLAPKVRKRLSWKVFVDAIHAARHYRTTAKPGEPHAKPTRAEEARVAANIVRAKLGIPLEPVGHDIDDDPIRGFG